MEKEWQALKPELVAALVDAFDEDRFAETLEFECGQRLSDLVARDVRFPRKVREVVNEAARAGWLECLVEAAQARRSGHDALQAVAADVLVGIEAEGPHFYQQPAIAEEVTIPDEGSGADLALSINALNRIESSIRNGDKWCRLRLQFAIKSQNDKSSTEGALTVIVAAPLMFSSVTERLFRFADFRKGLALELQGYDEQPHAASMRIPWGRSTGATIFSGEWHDFYNNPISFDVPTLAVVPDPTYLFRAEMVTLDRPRRSTLFALRQSGDDSEPELIRIDTIDDAICYEILEAFWETYHRALRALKKS